ncbi:hypothetical protein CBR_g42083 [Chara braunii]|uniref:IPT/TIG domain-containing protein n=1 Tax=Chara braunii TaxID=69332 RepID=A0A388LWU9_CHABU|nr:hypothetical protein CBR_g42083 [Chara braunii]|eukprot:GBG86800.1 hypothetical protein CBR_g42083 [Chara braunii]
MADKRDDSSGVGTMGHSPDTGGGAWCHSQVRCCRRPPSLPLYGIHQLVRSAVIVFLIAALLSVSVDERPSSFPIEFSGFGGRVGGGWLKLLMVANAQSSMVEPPTIYSISPSRGAVTGGTEVTLYGRAFSADQYTGGNTVYFGSTPCPVVSFLSTTTKVVCKTNPAVQPEEPLTVVVFVDGDVHRNGRFCCFRYVERLTPVIDYVAPTAGPPGTRITLVGENFGEAGTLRRIYIGDSLCTFGELPSERYMMEFQNANMSGCFSQICKASRV